ncbi:hypothetical protein [Rhodocyclus purpureus]|uniref:hypothetical protein n=1 Tax=Rhodocyclus purpureus TaxID=1067 RepID=UPI0019120EBE|nr:hypothetical protein [Rhodocyclus purpureus]
MNFGQLVTIFREQGVPDYFYTISGLASGECYGIEMIDDVWSVYYSERGLKKDISIHSTEDAACQELFRRVASLMEEELDQKLKLP